MAIDFQTLALVFGLLGNSISFMVFLAPLPTFYKIYKRKSTQGFQSLPYVVALLSAMLWIYYAFLQTGVVLLISINLVGCVFETAYVLVFLYYAASTVRIQTLKLLFSLNVFGFGLIVALTLGLADGANRTGIVELICLVFNLCVFAAPLGIIRQVIRTKSVEFMPFSLSFFLTLNAVMWLFYSLLICGYDIAIPNLLGFLFGIVQIVIYLMYMNSKKVVLDEPKIQKWSAHIIDVVKLGTIACPGLNPVVYPINGSKTDGDWKVESAKEMLRDHLEASNGKPVEAKIGNV